MDVGILRGEGGKGRLEAGTGESSPSEALCRGEEEAGPDSAICWEPEGQGKQVGTGGHMAQGLGVQSLLALNFTFPFVH